MNETPMSKPVSHAPAKPVHKREKHHWHVSSYSPSFGWLCEYDGKDEKEARAAYLKAKSGGTRFSVERDGVEYRRWK